jgi:hypothetical protein
MLPVLAAAAALAQEPAPAVVTEVHRSEVDVVTPYVAVLPEPAPAFARCAVRVIVDAQGVPTSATASKCEEPLASTAVEAVLRGRWRLREGQSAPLAFQVPFDARPLGRPDYIVMKRPDLPEDIPGHPEYTCAGHVGFTADGRSDFVHFTEECPEPARSEVIRALGQRLVVPWTVDGQAVPVLDEFRYGVHPEKDDPMPETGPDGLVVEHRELKVRRRVRPTYPPAALSNSAYAGPEGTDCKVRMYVDSAGVPYDMRFEGCPLVFHASAREALMRWRWKPALVGGEAVAAQFLINVKYKRES